MNFQASNVAKIFFAKFTSRSRDLNYVFFDLLFRLFFTPYNHEGFYYRDTASSSSYEELP